MRVRRRRAVWAIVEKALIYSPIPFNHLCPIFVFLCLFVFFFQGIDAINQSKVVELLKDGGAGGSDRRHSREGINGPGGQRGENEGDDSAEWNGVS